MVKGDDSCLKGRGFKSLCHILDGHFFTLFCCKKCLLEKTENKQKEARVGPFLSRKRQTSTAAKVNGQNGSICLVQFLPFILKTRFTTHRKIGTTGR